MVDLLEVSNLFISTDMASLAESDLGLLDVAVMELELSSRKLLVAVRALNLDKVANILQMCVELFLGRKRLVTLVAGPVLAALVLQVLYKGKKIIALAHSCLVLRVSAWSGDVAAWLADPGCLWLFVFLVLVCVLTWCEPWSIDFTRVSLGHQLDHLFQIVLPDLLEFEFLGLATFGASSRKSFLFVLLLNLFLAWLTDNRLANSALLEIEWDFLASCAAYKRLESAQL